MKLKRNIDRYDIKAMSEIEATMVHFHRRLTALEESSNNMTYKMNEVNQEFDTENFKRARESITRFILKLQNMELEIDELAKSVNEFTEKIRRIWGEN